MSEKELEHKCYMENEIGEVKGFAKEILASIKGDELGNVGILPTLRNHELRLDSLEKTRLETKVEKKTNKGTWTFIISVASSLLGALGISIFK